MKKISRKQREVDVRVGLLNRRPKNKNPRSNRASQLSCSGWQETNKWVDQKREDGLTYELINDNKLTLYLPETMNFSTHYELTAIYTTAIRKLASAKKILPRDAYRLRKVNFDNLISISTSAALVLTAELSKWDDTSWQRLTPQIMTWDPAILENFSDLGFFKLFATPPENINSVSQSTKSDLKLVQYIKGNCGDVQKTRELRTRITNIVGDHVSKWTFLRSGLDEAITNVSHHAYPDEYGFKNMEKTWYLTGSYSENTKELKIVFYDQGIGIPKSLPESEIWEKILGALSGVHPVGSYKDEVLLKAAVQLDRTSTAINDRGKGLQDLLSFIRHRGQGYLSIMSLRGLYKCTINSGKEVVKSEHFENPLCGTLIIWTVQLV